MISSIPDFRGRHDAESEYEADICPDRLYRITRFRPNGFFRSGQEPPSGGGPAPGAKAKPPVVSVSGNGLYLRIRGYPEPYDGKLSLLFAMENKDGTCYLNQFEKRYDVAPDPKTLWKDLKVGDDAGYPADNEASVCEILPGGGHMAVAASRRGRSHAHSGKPRDDSFFLDSDRDTGWTAAAVADGAGSARFSRKGSELACRTAVGEFLAIMRNGDQDRLEAILGEFKGRAEGVISLRSDRLGPLPAEEGGAVQDPTSLVLNPVVRAYKAIEEEVERRRAGGRGGPVEIRDYHTTLLFAALKRFRFGYCIASFWIGDGGLALCNPDGTGEAIVLGSPDAGEFAGQTRFLTMGEELDDKRGVRERIFFSFPEDFEALILATDGVTDPYFPSEESILSPEAWKHFWERILREGDGENPGCRELFSEDADGSLRQKDLLGWLGFWRKGEHDDRTILVVKKHPESRVIRGRRGQGPAAGTDGAPPPGTDGPRSG
ncbi:MAG: protein phosphatase 2C domain-containing protein [Deltaproteobacteria bacterium]|jgi:serine/threonine protein phosphatase PrpC|nr:protein phosphatase 2C domain-containing protein [Deltaproteobacteria bacterium]